jgi:hypothetical protein
VFCEKRKNNVVLGLVVTPFSTVWHNGGFSGYLSMLRLGCVYAFFPKMLIIIVPLSMLCLYPVHASSSWLALIPFVILIVDFFRKGADPSRSARHAISFCYYRQLLFGVLRADIAIILKFEICKSLEAPRENPAGGIKNAAFTSSV